MQQSALIDARALRRRLLAWHDRHGRKDLPWQRSRDPYHIWVSEIMLQQTQVRTVIPYYERFLKRFPDVQTLARAKLDSVLHHWTGLGYYARARNLKHAAETIDNEHGGHFPRHIEAVAALPGIGRSTAGAILAFAFDQRHPILDGNVRRVLTRLHAIETPVLQRDTEQALWGLAERYTPRTRVADYTQAIMDLGATLCRTRKPDCPACPLQQDCAAHAQGRPEKFPVRTKRKKLPVREIAMLMIRDARGHVLLTQRPPVGVWGGLWGFPECAPDVSAADHCHATLGLQIKTETPWPVRRHGFSHFQLHITPIPARLTGASRLKKASLYKNNHMGKAGLHKTSHVAMECVPTVWYNPDKPDTRGLAAPVKRLLQQLGKASLHKNSHKK
ncbi:MAG TPA: A/G-specific adenine glycosylase [Acidiferrobacterales bacterium]|nr:A/G-specific adenine glycosylase [Acidiferrobacterales bacterium]